ncbi:MAG: ATP-dependent DNA helicase RecG [Phycisphaerales bacterium]
MPSPVNILLTTPLAELDGVTTRKAALLHRLGLNTVADLLKHLPYRFEFYAGQSPIAQLPVDTIATVTGTVANCRWVGPQQRIFPGTPNFRGRGRGKGRFQLTLTDDTGSLGIVFFNAHYLVGKIVAGMPLIVTGKVTRFNDYPQMVNPKWQAMDADQSADGDASGGGGEKLRPVYPATENLPSEQISQLIEQILPGALTQIDDHFDADYRKAHALPELAAAYRMLHAPDSEDEAKSARRRLAYDELLLLQLGLTINRHYTRTQFRAPALRWSPAIDKHIRDRFPFTLTDAQDKVVRELAADLQKSEPANRLIQGDVGSGKTVVALYAMLLAVADRKQAALMAPTELLAEQHFASISAMLAGSNVRLALLTGSMPAAERAAMLDQIASGAASGGGGIDIVIGTHALLTESVRFNDLAVVIVDEQHRFGVKQRAALRSSRSNIEDRTSQIPHTLVMTATPIPRTLCLALFGDMDVSTITSLPPGRQPIDTRVVSPEKTDEVYRYLAKRIDKGEQLYVVVPAIDDSPAHLKAVTSHAKNIADHYFRDHKVAAVHGRLRSATRDRIMRQFRDHQIDILVATTVIEVGVDVPNASLMVVEHAERFGLAQLHQLRGRVGRGSTRSLCVYIAEPTTDDAAQRLAAIADTTDGFAIAEADSNIRGMGELIGTRQSGLPPLQIADLANDLDLLRMARRDALTLVDADPKLAHPSHALLRGRLVKQYGPALGLADVM